MLWLLEILIMVSYKALGFDGQINDCAKMHAKENWSSFLPITIYVYNKEKHQE
jgi:hypothetical protein